MEVGQINEGAVITLVNDELRQFCERIRANHLRAGQKASGRTAKSIRYELDAKGSIVHGVVKGRRAFETLELGRKAGKVPYNFRSIIRQWMQDKGIKAKPIPYVRKPSQRWRPKYTPQERGEMSLAGAIAYTIQTKGTSLYRQGGRADIYSPEIKRTKNNIRRRLLAIFQAEINHIHTNIAKRVVK